VRHERNLSLIFDLGETRKDLLGEFLAIAILISFYCGPVPASLLRGGETPRATYKTRWLRLGRSGIEGERGGSIGVWVGGGMEVVAKRCRSLCERAPTSVLRVFGNLVGYVGRKGISWNSWPVGTCAGKAGMGLENAGFAPARSRLGEFLVAPTRPFSLVRLCSLPVCLCALSLRSIK
jgi:hypothetical protein